MHDQAARWARAFSESNLDIYNLHGQFCNVYKAPKCWCWSNAVQIWAFCEQMSQAAEYAAEHLRAVINAERLQLKTEVKA